MSVYLEDHPPAVDQFRTQRRKPRWHPTPTVTAIVVHTAENTLDDIAPDTGAEAVARFISTRRTAGSYHSIVDSDSVVHVGRYEWEMFHEGTGGNRWSLGLSFACRAASWPSRLSDSAWHTLAVRQGALEASLMARWAQDAHGVPIPAERITQAQYRAGVPGFISHAELDPGRRSDPGPNFPWHAFLNAVHDFSGVDDPPMPPARNPYEAETNEALQILTDHSTYRGKLDGWFGPNALAALHHLKNTSLTLVDRNQDLAARLAASDADLIAARADLDAMRRQPATELLEELRPIISQAHELLQDRP